MITGQLQTNRDKQICDIALLMYKLHMLLQVLTWIWNQSNINENTRTIKYNEYKTFCRR